MNILPKRIRILLVLPLFVILLACGGGGGGAAPIGDLPVVIVPANIIAEAAGPGGSIVNFSGVSAVDSSGSLAATCLPASGATFPLGANTVTCTATNTSGTGSAGFTVTVRDTTPPIVIVPRNIISGTGSVSYTSSATDLVSGTLTPTCLPSSPVTLTVAGQTKTVTCTAKDSAQNSGSASFTVKYIQRGTTDPMDIYVYHIMTINQWKLWTSGTDGGFTAAELARTRANFDGDGTGANGTWVDDAAVAQGASSMLGVGPVGVAGGFVQDWNYSAPAINPYDGNVIYWGGGHNGSGDGSIYSLNLFSTSPTTTPASWVMKVPSARYISQAEPRPVWSHQTASNTTHTTTTTGTNSSGSFALTVTDGTSFLNGHRIYVEGGTPTGDTVASGGGTTTLTLTAALTGTVTAGTTVTTSTGYWATTNRDNVEMPIVPHTYWANVFEPNSSIIYLNGIYGFDQNAGVNIGKAFAYDPNLGTNDGMLVPYYDVGTTSPPYTNPTTFGYVAQSYTGTMGTICANSHDGKLYTFGKQNGGSKGILYQISNAATGSPTLATMGTTNIFAGMVGSLNGCVVIQDPKNGSGHMSYFVRNQNDPTTFGIWEDIEGTAVFAQPSFTYTFPTVATTFGLGWAYNSDDDKIAFTDGQDIWEFNVTWNGSAYATTDFVKITSGATGAGGSGDIPVAANDQYHLPGLAYLPWPYYSYAMCNYQQCFVYRRQ